MADPTEPESLSAEELDKWNEDIIDARAKLSIAVAALERIEDEVLDICPYFTGDAERKQTSLDLAREALERINNA